MAFQGRGIAFMSGFAAWGWQEVYDLTGVDYVSCLAQLQALNTARLALAVDSVGCLLLRVSDVNVRNDSITATPEGNVGNFGAPGAPVLDYDLSIPVHQLAGTLHRSTRRIRGIPLSFNISANIYTPTGPWLTLFDAYAALLVATCVIRSRHVGPPVTYTDFPITVINRGAVLTKRGTGRPFNSPRGRRMIA